MRPVLPDAVESVVWGGTTAGPVVVATAGLAAIALPLLNGHATDMVTSASSAQATQMLAVIFAGTVIYRAQHRESSSRVAIPVLALVAVGVAMRTSPSVATIGNMTFTGCSAAVRRTARSWAVSSSGIASCSRIPRRPRNGFASGSCRSARSGLSAPTSRVRMMSGRPPRSRAIDR